MTPPTKKIITVFGATGHQGGSIVSTFLNDPVLKNEWAVRAVTRDATKASALELAKKGVEVVSVSVTKQRTENEPCNNPCCRPTLTTSHLF